MKILTVTNLYPPHVLGGYEIECEKVVVQLRARGHDVRVLTSTYGLNGEEISNQLRCRLRLHGAGIAEWLPIEKLFFLEKYNHRAFWEEFHSFRPEVLYIWNMGGLSKGLCLTFHRTGVPCVYEVTDFWLAQSPSSDVWLRWWNHTPTVLHRSMLRVLLNTTRVAPFVNRAAPFSGWQDLAFERIAFCSKKLRALTAQAGHRVSHGKIRYPGIDVDEFYAPVRNEGAPVRNLLFAGRIDPHKGVETAIDALAILGKRGVSDFRLTIVGSGETGYVEELKQRAKQLGANNLVSWRSARYVDMPSIYRTHDALVFPSKWEEPFGLTRIEAMAAGIPVFSTRRGAGAELMRDGENGFVFDAEDSEQLAHLILAARAHPKTTARIAQEGQREVAERFTLRSYVDQIESALRGACS